MKHRKDLKTGKWVRTAEYYREMRAGRIRVNRAIRDVEPTNDDALDKWEDDSVVIYVSQVDKVHSVIRRAVERLDTSRDYKIKTAYDLVRDFVSDEEKRQHEAIEVECLFLLCGYTEPRNKYMAELVKYTVSERHRNGKGTYIFTPHDMSTMKNVWGEDTTEAITLVVAGFLDMRKKDDTIPPIKRWTEE